MTDSLVLGADIGGSTTRLAVVAADGAVLGLAHGGAGNPNAVGPGAARDEIAATFARCLADAGLGPEAAGRIGAAVVGMAGSSALTGAGAFLAGAFPGVEPGRVRLVSDFAVAFASGTHRPDGYVLLAGTGAGAAEVTAGEVTSRRDGWGWLLGDAGSGFWLGREAVRATLAQLADGRAGSSPSPLVRRVLETTGTRDQPSLLAHVYGRPPVQLARLARLVGETAAEDPVAAAIGRRAGTLLVDTLAALEPSPGAPVVLTGSVLTSPGPVRSAVLDELGSRLALEVREASGGLAGAVWSALVARRPELGSDADAHARLVARDFTARCG